ncbi:MAG TPA: chromate efflux transporter [Streptosporangiaceae bacterium]|jgi:chromate transporter|nr:chromate efflux transporter [Streptosporangiaceae bacterium]
MQPAEPASPQGYQASLATVLREWGRIGCIGFGGPPAHIALLRKLCVDRQGWLEAQEFQDAIATCNLLPGPASTQLAIFCAWRVRGRLGALAGGIAFIVPGLIVILALSVLFLEGTPPLWVRGTGAGAGAAVAAVAAAAGWSLAAPGWKRTAGSRRVRWIGYLLAGGAAAATIGPWLVLVLLGCGLTELAIRRQQAAGVRAVAVLPLLAGRAIRAAGPVRTLGAAAAGGVLIPVAWTAFKVGALSFGGGFVIIPLMQADAVGHHWMTSSQFLNGVALGQITPGPVVQTVATVGYAAAGIGGGLLAALIAFSPSFAFVLGGARHFNALRDNHHAQSFLDGAGPAAIGAILGSAITLARALSQPWQYAVLAGAAVLLLGLRRGVVLTLLAAGAVGLMIAVAGGPLP